MANATREAMLEEWLADRPESVKAAARAFPPWLTYRIGPTGQLASIESYSENEDGSCATCCVFAWYEVFGPELGVGVFGMPFTDLSPISGGV